jgi:threonine/homoserine/homoserine lactone efflux protein
MNIKVKAGLIVAGILVGSIAVSSVLKLVVPYVTSEIAFNTVMFGSIAILLYTVYNLILSKLEMDERYNKTLNNLKNLVDKK